MNKTMGLALAAVLIAGAAFAGGYFLATRMPGAAVGAPSGGPGAFAQLSEAERQQLSTMSESERQAFFEEKGIDMPAGGPGGAAGGPSGARGGGRPSLLDGTVASVTSDKITVTLSAGGSANAFLDDATVVAAADGKAAVIEEGASVLVFTEPEAAGVSAAKAVVIK